tara:strand:- start:330 stop:770 length:441 start_codon:yes stop_codon:yes gene_type:complete
MLSLLELIVFFLPLIIGFGTGMICRTKSSAGSIVKFRPPPWVFSVVWTLLYLMIGLSWVLSLRVGQSQLLSNVLYISLIFILSLWLVLYSCMDQKKWALAIMVLALMVTLVTYTMVPSVIAKGLLVPLFVWLLYALLISVFEVQKV